MDEKSFWTIVTWSSCSILKHLLLCLRDPELQFLQINGQSDGETTIKNSADFSMYLLNVAHVSSVMGDAFGDPACVRFSFANSAQNIEKAWARIKDALAKLK